MKAKIENGVLKVELPVNKEEVESKSGKTYIVATTHGNQRTELEHKGRQVSIGLTAFTYK